MFLKQSTLNSLMKQAYKSGLVVAQSEDEWLYLAGSYWEISIKMGYIPKQTMGNIISLVGEIPKPGERFRATKDGNQMETEMRLSVNDAAFGDNTLTITDVMIVGTQGTVQRILQDEYTGVIYLVNNVFVNIIDNGMIEKDKGEYGVEAPYFEKNSGILWKNNVCKLRACFRADDKNNKILENLEGIDLTPEVIK